MNYLKNEEHIILDSVHTYYFYAWASICVYLCVCRCAHTCAYVCVEARDLCLTYFSPYFLRQGLSLNLEFVDSARLAGKQVWGGS